MVPEKEMNKWGPLIVSDLQNVLHRSAVEYEEVDVRMSRVFS